MTERSEKKVGYGNPPIHTRWPPGVSGNPGGKEKGHKGLKTDLEAALNAINTIENKLTGKKVKGRNQQHATLRLVERAALGDIKAQALLFPLILQVLGAEDRHRGPKKLSALDEAILAEVLGTRLAETGGNDPGTAGEREDAPLLPPPDVAVDDEPSSDEPDDES